MYGKLFLGLWYCEQCWSSYNTEDGDAEEDTITGGTQFTSISHHQGEPLEMIFAHRTSSLIMLTSSVACISGKESEVERKEQREPPTIRDIVRPEDLCKGKDWWRCMACNVYVHSEAHLPRCPHVRASYISRSARQPMSRYLLSTTSAIFTHWPLLWPPICH